MVALDRAPSPQLPPLPAQAVGMIWAQSQDGFIGLDGGMPWKAPEDMAHFKDTTMGHPVIMGRRSWDAVPPRFRPFSGRSNLVLTSNAQAAAGIEAEGALVCASLPEAITLAHTLPGGELVWNTGGGSVYRQGVPLSDVAVVTVLDLVVGHGDTTAPDLSELYELHSVSPSADTFHPSPTGPGYRFEVWTRKAPRS